MLESDKSNVSSGISSRLDTAAIDLLLSTANSPHYHTLLLHGAARYCNASYVPFQRRPDLSELVSILALREKNVSTSLAPSPVDLNHFSIRLLRQGRRPLTVT